jgi:O-antigen biosynthesis protein
VLRCLGDRLLNDYSIPIPILMYHSISSVATASFRRYTTTPGDFSDQIRYLATNNFTPMTVSRLRSAIESKIPLPPRPVVLTFDDGFADFYTEAFPILLSSGFTATVYLVSGFTGRTGKWLRHAGEESRELLTWSQVRELDAHGIEFGAHTHSHPQLDTIEHSDARYEIAHSKRCIEDAIGHSVPSFAYPHGSYTPSIKRMVRLAGYTSACAINKRLSSVTDDPFALSRLEITTNTSIEHFGRMLDEPGNLLREIGPEWMRIAAKRIRRSLDGIGNHNDVVARQETWHQRNNEKE